MPRLTSGASLRRRGVRLLERDRLIDRGLAEDLGEDEHQQAGGEADQHPADQQSADRLLAVESDGSPSVSGRGSR